MKMNKSIALLVSLVLVLTITIVGSLAYLVADSVEVKNVFDPSRVTTTVDETIKDKVKSDVSIKNTGDIDAYIRAAVVVTWQDENGNVYGSAPVLDEDYTITWGTEWDRETTDGYYYWPSEVAPDANTGILISEAKLAENAAVPDGYFLCIEIIGSGIQSVPTSVVEENWDVTVADDGTISK